MLYKYLTNHNYQKLVNDGSIRVGTLQGYKSGAGNMVNDSMEGAKRLSGSYLTMNKKIAERSSSMSRIIGFSENAYGNNFCMLDCVIIEPNYFIFSMSGEYKDDEHRKWHKEEKYDTCYRINFPNTFFKHVTDSLKSIVPVKFLGLFPVIYYNESTGMDWFDLNESLPAFRLKDRADFSDQNEIRAVWQPLVNEEIKPLIFNGMLLNNYIEHYCTLTE